MRYKDFFTNDIVKLFYIYTIGHILNLINFEGIYWDDWTLYNVDYNAMISQFKMNGGLFTGYIHQLLLSIGNGVFIYRLLVFITFFLSGVLIYKILKNEKLFFEDSAFWISALYLTIPLNSAQIALINVPAILNLFLFFLAFYILSSYFNSKKRGIFTRLLILILFFYSFLLNSLLVFYAIVLIYIFYKMVQNNNNKKFINLIKEYLLKYIDFIVLPIIFFIVKKIYLAPTGLYAGYNKINLNIDIILNLINASFVTSIYAPIYISLQNSLHLWYIFLPILALVLIIVQNKNINIKASYNIVFFTFGIIFYILAVFPYVAVGKLPYLWGWESRHQILMPLGISFILYSIVTMFYKINKSIPILIFSFFIASFTVQNLYNGYRYIQDWYYQVAIEENFKTSKEIKNHSTFVAKVQLRDVLANGRELSFYEQNGRMKKVFAKDNKFIVKNINEIEMYKQYKPYKQYNFSSWEYQRPIFIQITKNKLYENNMPYFLKMFYYQFVDKDMFRKMAKQLIFIKIGRNSVK